MSYQQTMIEEWAQSPHQRRTTLVWYNYALDKPDAETLPGTCFLLLISEDPLTPGRDFVIQMAEYRDGEFLHLRFGKMLPVQGVIHWWTTIHVPDLCDELCPD